MQYFDVHTPKEEIESYARGRNVLSSEERILQLEKPGEGNMNVVLRIRTVERSLILKQSRPYVQKYNQIPAPLERIVIEHNFYRNVRRDSLSAHMPAVLDYDPKNYVLFLEDLGHCQDMTGIYEEKTVRDKDIRQLTSLLKKIHRAKVPMDFPDNLGMRRLNHQHIFVLPFLEDNGFDLNSIQPGLEELSRPYKKSKVLKSVVARVGEKYLTQGETVLHGDYYPGSWMIKGDHRYIIDPEFSFIGFAEFDLGVMAAHLILATHNAGILDTIHTNYDGGANQGLMAQIAGIEILRRLIGLAQLPLKRSLEEKEILLKMAYNLIGL
ncbi:MAG: phosphotransferase [Bacteroidota bacterium]